MSELFERFFCGVDLAAPDTTDLMVWVTKQIVGGSGYAGGGRFAIGHQTDARLRAAGAIKAYVDAGLMPRTMLDSFILSCNESPPQPDEFETVYMGQWNIPKDD